MGWGLSNEEQPHHLLHYRDSNWTRSSRERGRAHRSTWGTRTMVKEPNASAEMSFSSSSQKRLFHRLFRFNADLSTSALSLPRCVQPPSEHGRVKRVLAWVPLINSGSQTPIRSSKDQRLPIFFSFLGAKLWSMPHNRNIKRLNHKQFERNVFKINHKKKTNQLTHKHKFF